MFIFKDAMECNTSLISPNKVHSGLTAPKLDASLTQEHCATQRNVTSKSLSEKRSATGAERELINTKGL